MPELLANTNILMVFAYLGVKIQEHCWAEDGPFFLQSVGAASKLLCERQRHLVDSFINVHSNITDTLQYESKDGYKV